MKTERIFKLKSDLPGGHRKGELVSDRSTGVWFWESTSMTCMYQPDKEPAFFEEVKVAAFKPNDQVQLSYEGTRKVYGIVDKKCILTVRNVLNKNAGGEQMYELRLYGNKFYKVPESSLQKPCFYWFISSSGKLNKEVFYGAKTKLTNEYKYRRVTGNVFFDKESADKVLERINNQIKEMKNE